MDDADLFIEFARLGPAKLIELASAIRKRLSVPTVRRRRILARFDQVASTMEAALLESAADCPTTEERINNDIVRLSCGFPF